MVNHSRERRPENRTRPPREGAGASARDGPRGRSQQPCRLSRMRRQYGRQNLGGSSLPTTAQGATKADEEHSRFNQCRIAVQSAV
eukprot:scaffold194111_cov31-Tisochrysis_lutea.AAC.1